MSGLSADEIEEVREVFDLFDFWDGRDGFVDAAKLGDFLRCCGLNPTNDTCMKHGMVEKEGEKQFSFDEILVPYGAVAKIADAGTFADFMEAFKTFDREGQGFISGAELRHVLQSLGERLSEGEVNEIMGFTETKEDLDGNVKYEDFIKKVLAGPTEGKK